jgi:sucrose-6-phosphate hydrolase SacC (GH32 family)
MRFEKSNKILIDQTTHAPLAFNDWSDPFLFQKDGRTFITCGGNERRTGGRAVIHLYEGSADLTQWKHLGPIHVSPDRAAYNIECTNLMKIGDKWVLLYSAHRPAEYYVGDLDVDNRQFRIERFGVLDAGSSYAARFSALPTGEVIVWNWIPTNMPADRAWNGAMAMPRIVTIDDDRCLRQHPWRSFEKLRGARSSMPDFELLNGVVALDTSFAGSSCELRIRFSRVTADTVGLRFRCAEGKAPGAEVRFRRRDGSLAVNQRYAFYSREDEITLIVYLDRRIIEVFTANGTVALATLVSAGQDAAGIEVFATGGNATVSDLEFWPMTPASFSLEHFQ